MATSVWHSTQHIVSEFLLEAIRKAQFPIMLSGHSVPVRLVDFLVKP